MDVRYIAIIAIVFLILILIGLAIVNYAGEEMFDRYKKLSELPCGITPIELANYFSQEELDGRLRINTKPNMFCDSMSSNGVLTLSEKYANSQDFAGVVICSHELGHSIQFRDNTKKMISHAKLIKVSKIFSFFTSPFALLGIVFLLFELYLIGIGLIVLSVICFAVAVLSKFSTIKIEKEASQNAIKILEKYTNFSTEEIKIASRFLNSAKLTYIGDLLRVMLKWTFLVKK